MTFLNPILLYAGLACIAVPIIVHLLTRRRRKPIAWGAMRFLLEAYKKHRRRLSLEQLILLACRCALVALIALALGKPIVDGLAAGTSGPRVLYLLIDNSIASTVVGADGKSALDRHKAAAASLLTKLDTLRADRAAVLALGAPIDALVVPPSSDLAAVSRVVESLEATDSRADLAAAVSRVAADLGTGEPGSNVTLALLSDWRAGSADVDRPLPTLTGAVRPGESIPLVLAASPAADAVDNISVLRTEPLRPILFSTDNAGGAAEAAPESTPVRVLLSRRGPGVGIGAATKLLVRVDSIGAAAKPSPPTEAVVRWNPGQEQASITVSVSTPAVASGMPTIVAEIDRDALGADNTRRRPVESRPWLSVGLATTPGAARPSSIDRFGAADWLRLGVSPDLSVTPVAGLRVTDIEPRSIGTGGALAGLDALLIPAPDRLDGSGWTRVGEFARSGGLVVVFAPSEEGVQLWADGFLKAVGSPWTIGREARAYTPPTDVAETPGSSDLLALLSGEFAELAKPVRVSRIVPVDVPQGSGDVLLRLRDGSPLLLAAPPKAEGGGGAPGGSSSRGLVVLFTSACDLRWTDLPTKPLMVPLIQEIVRQGIGAARGVWSGDAGGIPLVPAGTVELRGTDSADIVSFVGGTPAPVRKAGLWTARDARGTALGLVAVNPDLSGCDTTPRAVSALTAWLGTIAGPQRVQWSTELAGVSAAPGTAATSALDTQSRPPISAPLLAAAAAMALLELFLARLFSHASVSQAGTSIPNRSAAA